MFNTNKFNIYTIAEITLTLVSVGLIFTYAFELLLNGEFNQSPTLILGTATIIAKLLERRGAFRSIHVPEPTRDIKARIVKLFVTPVALLVIHASSSGCSTLCAIALTILGVLLSLELLSSDFDTHMDFTDALLALIGVGSGVSYLF